MIRLVVVISLFIAGGIFGGWTGIFAALLFCGVLGAFFPARARVRELPSDADDRVWEKIEPARRGRNADPTRPDDDHPLMLTNEVRRKS